MLSLKEIPRERERRRDAVSTVSRAFKLAGIRYPTSTDFVTLQVRNDRSTLAETCALHKDFAASRHIQKVFVRHCLHIAAVSVLSSIDVHTMTQPEAHLSGVASMISPNVKGDAAMNLADVELSHSTGNVPRDSEHG